MKILIAGDFVPRERVLKKIKNNDYADIFADLKPYIDQADYSILNLEAPIVSDTSKARPILKVGPALSAPVETIDVIKAAGFDCVTMANNHILDYGDDALIETMTLLKNKELDFVGVGMNIQEASQVLIKHYEDKTVSVINCCEEEFSIADNESPGACPIDIVKTVKSIQKAKRETDYVIVIIHGGVELYSYPTPRMKELYRFFVDSGADAVINHHQHCYCGCEVYNEKPILYGLGNLCFDRDYINPAWYYGVMACIELSQTVSVKLIPYRQCEKEPRVVVLKEEEINNKVLLDIERINGVVSDDTALMAAYQNHLNKKRVQVFSRFSSFSGRIKALLVRFHLINVNPGVKKALRIYEYLACDSHRDIAKNVFKNYLNK